MVRIYRCDHDTSEELRSKQINEIRADLVSELVQRSQLPTTGALSIITTTRKVRNRSKAMVMDTYIISASISV